MRSGGFPVIPGFFTPLFPIFSAPSFPRKRESTAWRTFTEVADSRPWERGRPARTAALARGAPSF